MLLEIDCLRWALYIAQMAVIPTSLAVAKLLVPLSECSQPLACKLDGQMLCSKHGIMKHQSLSGIHKLHSVLLALLHQFVRYCHLGRGRMGDSRLSRMSKSVNSIKCSESVKRTHCNRDTKYSQAIFPDLETAHNCLSLMLGHCPYLILRVSSLPSHEKMAGLSPSF